MSDMEAEPHNGNIKRKREVSPETKEKRLEMRRERDRERKRSKPKIASPEVRERRLEKRRELYRKKRLQEIGLSLAMSRNKINSNYPKSPPTPGKSLSSKEVCKKCNVFMDESFGINHAYCQSVNDCGLRQNPIVEKKESAKEEPIIRKEPEKKEPEKREPEKKSEEFSVGSANLSLVYICLCTYCNI
jgi:hypothetical protein